MESGRILWFNQNRGVGYIEHDDGRAVYFHDGAVPDERFLQRLVKGARVAFEMFTTRTGWEAGNVMIMRE